MFYENQPLEQQKQYKEMLEIVGSLSAEQSERDKLSVSKYLQNLFS